jgi:hypothetical protein
LPDQLSVAARKGTTLAARVRQAHGTFFRRKRPQLQVKGACGEKMFRWAETPPKWRPF